MVYVAADCYFNQQTEDKINNWNNLIKNNDEVLILGHFCDSDSSFFLSKINGTKCLIDRKTNPLYLNFSKEELIALGFTRAAHSCGFIIDKNNNQTVHLLPDIEVINRFKAGHMLYGASARSITKQKKVWKDNILSLSFQDWDNTPIEYEEIPKLIDNMKKMEGDFIVG